MIFIPLYLRCFYNFCSVKGFCGYFTYGYIQQRFFAIFPHVKCFFISVLDEFKMLVSGEAKASVEKFLEDNHSFEEYTNVSNL